MSDINFKGSPRYKPDKVTRRSLKLRLPAGNLSPVRATGLLLPALVEVVVVPTKPKWPVRAENCPSRGGAEPLRYSRAGNQKNSGTDKSNSSGDPSASDGFNQIRPWSAIKIFAIAFQNGTN